MAAPRFDSPPAAGALPAAFLSPGAVAACVIAPGCFDCLGSWCVAGSITARRENGSSRAGFSFSAGWALPTRQKGETMLSDEALEEVQAFMLDFPSHVLKIENREATYEQQGWNGRCWSICIDCCSRPVWLQIDRFRTVRDALDDFLGRFDEITRTLAVCSGQLS